MSRAAAWRSQPLSFNLIILSANFSGVNPATWDGISASAYPSPYYPNRIRIVFFLPWPFREISLFIVRQPLNIFCESFRDWVANLIYAITKCWKIKIEMFQRIIYKRYIHMKNVLHKLNKSKKLNLQKQKKLFIFKLFIIHT